MKAIFFAFLMCGLLLLITSKTTQAQTLEDYLSKYTAENGQGYLQPLLNVYSMNLHSGLFRSAHIKRNGFQFYFGVSATNAFIPDNQRTFTATPEGLFELKTPIEASTVFGSGESVTLQDENGTSYTFPGGFQKESFLVFMPQITVGSLFGTNLTLRYFTYNFDDDIGKMDFLGVGLRHSISQYIPDSPVDVALGYYWHYTSLGSLVKTRNNLISLQGSYDLSVLTFYAALGYAYSTMDIEYTYENEDPITMDLQFRNPIRGTAGVAISLKPFVLNIEYNQARQGAVSAGLGFTIGNN